VELTLAASDAIEAHLKRQLEEIERRGDDYQDQVLMFLARMGDVASAALAQVRAEYESL
jgi:hypothetical protein